jgi:cytochrome bd-type quinol oxidase subunit 1
MAGGFLRSIFWLAPLIVRLKTQYLRTNDGIYNRVARFWAKIFGISLSKMVSP